MGFGDLLYDGEPEASAGGAARGGGSVEAVEDEW
jgi:hypothetical protein